MLAAGQILRPLPQSASLAGGAVRAAQSCCARGIASLLHQLAACVYVDSELMKAVPKAGARFDALLWSDEHCFACGDFAFSSLFATVSLVAF